MKENMLTKFLQVYSGDEDLKTRNIDCGINLTVICMDTMSDDNKVSAYVLQPLAYINDAQSVRDVQNRIMAGAVVKRVVALDEAIQDYTNGYTLIFDDNGNGIPKN